ncbi:hypothetical protein OJAV_G00135170 [Oryzias javanicus]|uniref:WD repeat-containing protein 74 n=1 Tax=Oryzias javanicus TaxID=123683 RepID=A0A437CTT4_ORYJA|nr:hypothetical protein OJAV_G00135170 [Oryzias javanicus]
MGDRSRLCSVWLGSETGILKGVSLTRKQAFNFCDTRQLSRDQEVRALCWGDPAESELLLGLVDGTVRTFSTEKGAFTDARRCGDPQDGCFAGLAALGGSTLVSCTESGAVRVWAEDSREPVTQLEAGKAVCRMRQSPVDRNKNLRDDWLALRRPHWVRDAAFIPDSDKVVTCTGYHQVHVFDPSTLSGAPSWRRSTASNPLTALSLTAAAPRCVGTRRAIALLDLRKGLVCGCLKGCRGARPAVPPLPAVVRPRSGPLLRIHSLEDRRLMHKVYLKSRLNCLLLASRELEEGAGAGEWRSRGERGRENEVWASLEQCEETTKRKQQRRTRRRRREEKEGKN